MGSLTPTEQITKRHDYIEINTAKSCHLSGDKILMKKRFVHGKISTAPFIMINKEDVAHNNKEDLYFSERFNDFLKKWKTIIVKHKNSSGGEGIFLMKSKEDFDNFFRNELNFDASLLKNYIFERYYTYSKEYRLHVTKDGCFLANRKMLKEDAEDRWHRHANNSVWINEDNPLFDKPTSWDNIVNGAINAMKSVELDIAAVDVKVQNNKHDNPLYIILETNSAPALGDVSIEKYTEILTNIING